MGIFNNYKMNNGGGGDTPINIVKTIPYIGDGANENVIGGIPLECSNIEIVNATPITGYGVAIIELVRDANRGSVTVPNGVFPVVASWTDDSVTLTGDNGTTRGNETGVHYMAICYNYKIEE